VLPVIIVVAGAVPTVTANVVDAFPQLLLNVTPTLPDAAVALHVVVIEFVP
jgi:folate-dependent phosphoribosylglycinamide formyltransferase PurN